MGKFSPKNQNHQFKLKCDTQTNSNMQNLVVVLTLFIFDQKYPFWVNLIQKIKTVSLSWNLVHRLIRICIIQHFLHFWPEVFFLGKFGLKIQNCLFGVKLGTTINSSEKNSMKMFIFSVFEWKYPVLGNLFHKNQNCLLRVKFRTQTDSNI